MSKTPPQSPPTDLDPNAAARPDSGIFGLGTRPEDSHVVVVPVPFEATTSYGGGAAEGPAAVLRASRQVDLFDVETGRPYAVGIAMLPEPQQVRAWDREARALARPVIEAGGALDPETRERALAVDRIMELLNAHVGATVSRLLDAGKLVATLGGDHSVPFAAIAAHARRSPGLGILHLDAHADLRRAYEGFAWSHASIMDNVMARVPEVARLVQVGIRDSCEEEHERISGSEGRIVTHFDADLSTASFAGETWDSQVERIVASLPKDVYLSFDVDGLDPTLCPHTGTPVPGGLGFHEACALVRGVVRSGRRIVGLDLTEVAPGPRGDEWDGNVGARLLYKMIGWMLVSQGLSQPPARGAS